MPDTQNNSIFPVEALSARELELCSQERGPAFTEEELADLERSVMQDVQDMQDMSDGDVISEYQRHIGGLSFPSNSNSRLVELLLDLRNTLIQSHPIETISDNIDLIDQEIQRLREEVQNLSTDEFGYVTSNVVELTTSPDTESSESEEERFIRETRQQRIDSPVTLNEDSRPSVSGYSGVSGFSGVSGYWAADPRSYQRVAWSSEMESSLTISANGSYRTGHTIAFGNSINREISIPYKYVGVITELSKRRTCDLHGFEESRLLGFVAHIKEEACKANLNRKYVGSTCSSNYMYEKVMKHLNNQ